VGTRKEILPTMLLLPMSLLSLTLKGTITVCGSSQDLILICSLDPAEGGNAFPAATNGTRIPK